MSRQRPTYNSFLPVQTIPTTSHNGGELIITGCRGIPASYGGFETLAEHLAKFMTSYGWQVTVYCQGDKAKGYGEEYWHGIRLIWLSTSLPNPLGSIVFDYKSLSHISKGEGVVLTLGYNTAIFNLIFHRRLRPNIIHMDGIEWKRSKWSAPVKLWFRINELIACLTANFFIADHPEIKKRLKNWCKDDKIGLLYYGTDILKDIDATPVIEMGLEPMRYVLVVARPEPENSILEIVKAFSLRERGMPLVVLGEYSEKIRYQQEVREAAGPEVRFLGTIYEKNKINALRYYCRFYIHGHTVGGTNPSLVEAMGASNAILARDNVFNRWVTGDNGALFFKDEEELDKNITFLLNDTVKYMAIKEEALKRAQEQFTWDNVLHNYKIFLETALRA